MTGRRPVYFQRPAWPVTGTKIMACACPRQAGRPGGLFGPLTAMYSGFPFTSTYNYMHVAMPPV
jgi:hypothetical protein